MSRSLRIWALLAALAVFFCGCQTTSKKTTPSTAQGIEFVMNTWVEQQWYGGEAQRTYDEVLARLRDLENRLSLYQDQSEIAALNAAAGKTPVKVSEDTFALLSRAKELCAESGGVFDVTIAPLTLEWGITGEFPHVPTEEKISSACLLVDYRDLILDRENRTAMLTREGMKVDLGGIAKGTAASVVAHIPAQNGSTGYLSIGGNMMVHGKKPDGSEILVGIRDPRGDQNDPIGAVKMDGLTMATTGDYERYFEQDGIRYHHVLDPFTGYPADTDLISVTVLSKDGALADCLSTTIFLKGSQAFSDYFNRDDCLVMAVTADHQVYASAGFWERFTVNPAKTQYTFHNN